MSWKEIPSDTPIGTQNLYSTVNGNVIQTFRHIPIKNAYNAFLYPLGTETNTAPSMVVPNQAMSVKEILERYARGLPLTERQPIYHGDEYVPDVDNMDLSELQTLGEQTRQTINSYRDYQEAMKTEKQRAEAEEYRQLKAEKEQQLKTELKPIV